MILRSQACQKPKYVAPGCKVILVTPHSALLLQYSIQGFEKGDEIDLDDEE